MEQKSCDWNHATSSERGRPRRPPSKRTTYTLAIRPGRQRTAALRQKRLRVPGQKALFYGFMLNGRVLNYRIMPAISGLQVRPHLQPDTELV